LAVTLDAVIPLEPNWTLAEVGRVIIRLLDDQLIEVAEEELELVEDEFAEETPTFPLEETELVAETTTFPLELVAAEVIPPFDDAELALEDELVADPDTATVVEEALTFPEDELDEELTAVLPVAPALTLSSCNIFMRPDIAFFCWINGVRRLRVVNESWEPTNNTIIPRAGRR
jgi:hypothetical protein